MPNKLELPLTVSLFSLVVASTPSIAKADVVVRVEGGSRFNDERAEYPIEIEPHFTFGPDNVYGAAGYGGGVRLGVPLLVGHLGPVSDSLAISFGGDVVHYENCYFGSECGANYLILPVAAQFNIFVFHSFSFFGEGGAYLYKGWFDGCTPVDGTGCSAPSDLGILPALAIGGRLHLGAFSAITLRLGYPTTTLGLSFL